MDNYYGWGLPFNASAHGAGIDNLIYIFHYFMAALFIGWFIYLVLALVKFRQRPGHKATYKEQHFKVPTYVEVFVALFEVVLLVGFAFPLFNSYRNDVPPQKESVEVRVIAEQFAWNIHYPGPDGKFGRTKLDLINPGNPIGLDRSDSAAVDDITTINQLHIPVDKPIIVYLSSKDVIHSFALPVMRVKQDAIPGQEVTVWFEAAETGEFEIACAQLCGLGHYRMRGFFTVHPQSEYDAWIQDNLPEEAKPKAPTPPPAPPPVVTNPPVQTAQGVATP